MLNRICRECYSDPQAVYETLKQRGMDLVTVTDHDSIDAVEQLRKYHDFFLSEEVTCTTPNGNEIHLGVYGIDEKRHHELQRRRNDLPSFTSYLSEQRLFSSINHVFSCLTGRRTDQDFAFFEHFIPGVEVINGHMPPSSNLSAAELARRWRKAAVGGSDAHTLAGLGHTYTQVPTAAGVESYLLGLKRGRSKVWGASGNYFKLTRVIVEIGLQMTGENEWATALAPLLLAVPIVTLFSYVSEIIFADKWARRVMNEGNLARVLYLPRGVE
jgi:predicted metal-dependent phosphoesterase TrpH